MIQAKPSSFTIPNSTCSTSEWATDVRGTNVSAAPRAATTFLSHRSSRSSRRPANMSGIIRKLRAPLGDRSAFARAANKISRRTHAAVLQDNYGTVRAARVTSRVAALFRGTVPVQRWVDPGVDRKDLPCLMVARITLKIFTLKKLASAVQLRPGHHHSVTSSIRMFTKIIGRREYGAISAVRNARPSRG
jgi:hypothetical protein